MCPRKNCWPCENKEGRGMMDCQSESVVYRVTCNQCKEDGVVTEYLGETSRSMHQRAMEHQRNLKNRKEDSTLWLHCEEAHNSLEVGFTIALVRKHKTPLTRQTHEMVEM